MIHPEYHSDGPYSDERIDCLAPNASRSSYCGWKRGHSCPHAWDVDELRFALEQAQEAVERARIVTRIALGTSRHYVNAAELDYALAIPNTPLHEDGRFDFSEPVPIVMSDDDNIKPDTPRIEISATAYYLGNDAKPIREAVVDALRDFARNMSFVTRRTTTRQTTDETA